MAGSRGVRGTESFERRRARRRTLVRARGSELLAFAILTLVLFPPLAPAVWILSRRRLAAAGRLSPTERGLT